MKIAALIARILLGLVFLVFGLNGFLNFIPAGPLPSGVAGQFISSLLVSHFALLVAAIQLVGGVLLLVNRYVPLAITILGPVIVNILFYHLLMEPKGLAVAVPVAILWVILLVKNRQYFASLFVARTA